MRHDSSHSVVHALPPHGWPIIQSIGQQMTRSTTDHRMHGKQHMTPHTLSGGVNCCFPIITYLSATTCGGAANILLVFLGYIEFTEDSGTMTPNAMDVMMECSGTTTPIAGLVECSGTTTPIAGLVECSGTTIPIAVLLDVMICGRFLIGLIGLIGLKVREFGNHGSNGFAK